MLQLIHMTATYSNAMLIAILPHISDCTKQLDLPIPQPMTTSQVSHFGASPYKDVISGGIWLTNGYWFIFEKGYVNGFRSPENWFTEQEITNLQQYVGKDNITTNEAVDLARNCFRKLGYNGDDFHMTEPPTILNGPHDNKQLGHIPFCRIEWKSPDPKNQEELDQSYDIRFDIDLHLKQMTGMYLSSRKFWHSDPPIDVVPELQSDYRKRTSMKMFVRTNAPTHFP